MSRCNKVTSQPKGKVNGENGTVNACDINQVPNTALSCSSAGIMDWLS